MTRNEADDKIWRITYTCMLNQRYYQTVRSAQWWADRIIRIVVGILAVAGAILSFEKSESYGWLPFQLSVAGVISAFILNVLPIGDWFSENSELYRRWTSLRQQSEKLDIRLQKSSAPSIDANMLAAIEELQTEKSQIDAAETKPIRWLLRRTQRELNKSRYNVPTGTYQEVVEKKAQELLQRQPQAGVPA